MAHPTGWLRIKSSARRNSTGKADELQQEDETRSGGAATPPASAFSRHLHAVARNQWRTHGHHRRPRLSVDGETRHLRQSGIIDRRHRSRDSKGLKAEIMV